MGISLYKLLKAKTAYPLPLAAVRAYKYSSTFDIYESTLVGEDGLHGATGALRDHFTKGVNLALVSNLCTYESQDEPSCVRHPIDPYV